VVLGQVSVNGKVADPGTKATYPGDAIKVKGKLITAERNTTYVIFYKPKGVMSSLADPHGRPTLHDYIRNLKTRLFPVGRLDFNSEGLLLLTNDGDFSHAVLEKKDLLRTYEVKIKGQANADILSRIESGARIKVNSKKMVRPVHVQLKRTLQSKSVIEVSFAESGVLEIKSLFEMRGLLVDKIVRTQIGSCALDDLKPGEMRFLKKREIASFLSDEKKVDTKK
jgi:pseudouridine synthase